jgi:GTP-binding protein EngB required for normal cell division
LAEVQSDVKLIQDYEAIRHREYQLITSMLDVLPKIPKLGEERVGQVRDALFHADHPFLMVFIGPFNSGKSSMINGLLGSGELLKSGPTPTTDRITLLRYGDEAQVTNSGGETDTVFHPSAMLKRVSFVDTPGLESTVKAHEELTRKFLHRADVVVMVMLATHAMTQSNLRYLQTFREYGKKVIIAINQIDLLSDEERATVKEYVQNQSKDMLGIVPEIWMVSARWGMEATKDGTRNEELWQKSGLGQIESYINRSLGDVDRLRQKLQTPLQILQNVHSAAVVAVRETQSTFDQYRGITENVDRQVESQKREQMKNISETAKEIEYRFSTAADRGGEALRDLFRFSNALKSFGSGLLELTGLTRFFQRSDAPSAIRAAFLQHRVFEPLEELPGVVDKLGPRLEGQDMQDIDNLVKYGQREVGNLPVTMREKVIGTIQAPNKYDRVLLQEIRPELERIEDQARNIETKHLESVRRNTLLYLAVWEIIILILLIALFNTWKEIAGPNNAPTPFILFLILASAAIGGFAFLPVRGRMMAAAHANQLLKLKDQYLETLHRATGKQLEYALKLRRDSISPLTRLVEAQAEIQDKQLNTLKMTEQEMVKLEADLNAFGKRKFMGIAM